MLRVIAQDLGRGGATLQGCVESGFVKILSIARTCVVALGGLWYSVASVASGAPPLFVLNSLEANVSVIDPVTWAETARIPTGKEPHHLYLTPDEKSIIVANALGDTLTFVDPRTAEVQRTVRGIVDPYHLRFSPDMKWFITAANRLNHVDFYRWDGKDLTLVQRVATSRTPSHLWIDSRSTTVYSTMQDSDELVAIDIATQTIKWRVKTGPMPADVYGSPDGKHLFVGLTGGDSVEVFDISGREAVSVKRIKTGNGAHAFRAAGDGRHLYVSNRVANSISKIDMNTQQVVESYPVQAALIAWMFRRTDATSTSVRVGHGSCPWWTPRPRRWCARSTWANRPTACGPCSTRRVERCTAGQRYVSQRSSCTARQASQCYCIDSCLGMFHQRYCAK